MLVHWTKATSCILFSLSSQVTFLFHSESNITHGSLQPDRYLWVAARPLRHNLARVAVTLSAVIGRLLRSPFFVSRSVRVQQKENRLFRGVRRDAHRGASETTEVAAAWWGGSTCPVWGQTVLLSGATAVCRCGFESHTHFTLLLRRAPFYTSHYGAE